MRLCPGLGCSTLVRKGRCPAHAVHVEQQRPNVDVRRLYRTVRWAKLRALVLAEQPLCADCLMEEVTLTPATDVDHIKPHRGDLTLFWSRANLQGLCHECHGRKTQRGE